MNNHNHNHKELHMNHPKLLGMLALIASISVTADTVLDGYRGKLDTSLARIETDANAEREKAHKTYLRLLHKIKGEVQASGSLSKTTAVVAEINRFEAEGKLSNGNFSVIELRKVHDAFSSELLKISRNKQIKTRTLYGKYDAFLTKLQTTRVKQGDLEGARRVQDERNRAKDLKPDVEWKPLKPPTGKLVSSRDKDPFVGQWRESSGAWGGTELTITKVGNGYEMRHNLNSAISKQSVVIDGNLILQWQHHNWGNHTVVLTNTRDGLLFRQWRTPYTGRMPSGSMEWLNVTLTKVHE